MAFWVPVCTHLYEGGIRLNFERLPALPWRSYLHMYCLMEVWFNGQPQARQGKGHDA